MSTRIDDWGSANLQIKPPTSAPPPESESVVYGADQVVAYIDGRGQPTTPDKATMARVWDKKGMRTVRLKP